MNQIFLNLIGVQMRNKLFVFFWIIILFAALSCSDDSVNYDTDVEVGSAIGQKIPDGIVLKTVDGKSEFNFDDNKGKVILIDYWEQWCAPCKAGMPNTIALHDNYNKKGLVVLAITKTSTVDDINKLNMQNLTNLRDDFVFKVGNSGYNFGSYYGINTIPRLLVLDKSGVLQYNGNAYYSTVEELIQELLDK